MRWKKVGMVMVVSLEDEWEELMALLYSPGFRPRGRVECHQEEGFQHCLHSTVLANG